MNKEAINGAFKDTAYVQTIQNRLAKIRNCFIGTQIYKRLFGECDKEYRRRLLVEYWKSTYRNFHSVLYSFDDPFSLEEERWLEAHFCLEGVLKLYREKHTETISEKLYPRTWTTFQNKPLDKRKRWRKK